ncbi:MAG: phage tail tape measure protein, partial [Lachnospiraceae bacterium]|nr:phage tail tape measure protein [Lachnospiraceae bacterium]
MTGNNYTNKLGVDTNEFKKAMKELNAGLNSLKQQINYAAASSGDYNNRIELLTKNISENVKKEELLEEVLKKLKDATNKDVKAIANAEAALYKQKTATELAKKDLDKFKTAHDESMIAEDKHKVKIDTLSLALSETLINAVRKACSALVDFAKETINTGMQFESAFAGVRKVVSGTEEDFKGLEKEIRQTALERPISAEQLSSIYQMGSQLGIAKESLKDFSDSIIDLAKTSNLTEEAGATMIAQYANVMNLPQEDYRRFASTLSYLGSTTATTESAIMELMSRLSGAGATIGLTHQDLLALATSMGSVGINAEAGGSAISTILSKIDMAVDKNGESLTTWANVAGMTAETFKKAWKEDTMSAVKAVISGLGDAKKGGESLNLILEDLGI